LNFLFKNFGRNQEEIETTRQPGSRDEKIILFKKLLAKTLMKLLVAPKLAQKVLELPQSSVAATNTKPEKRK